MIAHILYYCSICRVLGPDCSILGYNRNCMRQFTAEIISLYSVQDGIVVIVWVMEKYCFETYPAYPLYATWYQSPSIFITQMFVEPLGMLRMTAQLVLPHWRRFKP